MLSLISSTPSPYARKVRVALAEKGIEFELKTEVPWESTAETLLRNPLQKLPILIVPGNEDSGKDSTSIFESHYILEWLEIKYPAPQWPALIPDDVEEKLLAKQIEVVADGMCDALVLRFFESKRSEDARSEAWEARQSRKVDNGVRWLAQAASKSQNGFLVGGQFTIADIATCAVLGYMALRFTEHPWKEHFPILATYFEKLQDRQSFKDTMPYAQTIRERVI